MHAGQLEGCADVRAYLGEFGSDTDEVKCRPYTYCEKRHSKHLQSCSNQRVVVRKRLVLEFVLA